MIGAVRHERGWLAGAIVAGFVGAVLGGFALFFGYGLSLVLADVIPGQLGLSFEALASNEATRLIVAALAPALLLHFAVGVGFAVVYAWQVEPRLAGPGWWRGATFALVPWVLSLAVFLPAVGGGLLGLGLGAGLLPMIGSLIAHLVYGAALGWVYERGWVELAHEDEESARANLGAEQGIAVGLVVGGIVGVAAGALLGPSWLGPGTSIGWALLAGGVGGATIGAFVGSYEGLSHPKRRPS